MLAETNKLKHGHNSGEKHNYEAFEEEQKQ